MPDSPSRQREWLRRAENARIAAEHERARAARQRSWAAQSDREAMLFDEREQQCLRLAGEAGRAAA